MMDAVESLTEDQFLDLLLEVYNIGWEDCANDKLDSVGNRLWRIRTRVEEWLEI